MAAAAAGNFPVVEGFSSYGSGGSVEYNNIPMPANVASGELLLMFLAANGANSYENTPTGWTYLLGNANYGGSRASIVAKVSDGSETTETLRMGGGGARCAAQVYRISNWGGTIGSEASHVDDIQYSMNTNNSVTSVSFNTLTLANPAGSRDALWFPVITTDESDTTSTAPSGYAGTWQNTQCGNGASGSCTIASGYQQIAAAAETPGNAGIGVTQSGWGIVVAVLPA